MADEPLSDSEMPDDDIDALAAFVEVDPDRTRMIVRATEQWHRDHE